MDVPLIVLEREIEHAASELAAARRRIDSSLASPDEPNPLASWRRASSRTTFLELCDGPAQLEREAARDWVYVLTLERVLWPDTVRAAIAWRVTTVDVDKPERLAATPRALLEQVLTDAPERRRIWAAALISGAGTASDLARVLAERRAEATQLLGVADPDLFELPADPSSLASAAASKALDATDAVRPREIGSWDDALATMLATGAAQGWPARLGQRWIADIFRPSKLCDGLMLDLGPMPAAWGATSFARALGQFGAALAVADAPRALPFPMAHRPFDLRVARRAALFGALVADPVFGVRVRGLSRSAARDEARELGRALALHLRLAAARVLLRGALLLPARERRNRFEELTAQAIGVPVAGELAGVLPRLVPEDGARLLGAILAVQDRRDLVERFDEDWFLNPRAAHALREEHAVAPPPRATTVELERAMVELDHAVAEIAG